VVADAWIAHQRPDGTFTEYVPREQGHGGKQDQYGTAMMAYALLAEGEHDGNEAAIGAGLRAIPFAAGHIDPDTRAIFSNLALAAAYNLVKADLSGDQRFEAVREGWERRLRHIHLIVLGERRPYYNYELLEAVAVLELARTGLTSTVPGSVLANRARAVALARKVVTSRIPSATAPYTRTTPAGERLVFLSDPPLNPPAYLAFSTALLARALVLLGPQPPANGSELLRDAVRTLATVAGPDGDLGYLGRTQEQAWTLTLGAYGAAMAAALPGATSAEAGTDRALAERALARLQARYVGGPHGLWITPAVGEDLRQGVRGLDPYAAGVSYTGLTLLGLIWATDQLSNVTVPATSIPADRPGAFLLSRGPSAFAVVRTPRLWYAVKQSVASREPFGLDYKRDLRFDSGLAALKVLGAGGGWRDLLRLRPRTKHMLDSSGPVLLDGGRFGRAIGQGLRATGATVVWSGGFRDVSGPWLRRAVEVTYAPAGCGLEISMPVLRHDRVEYSVFFRHRPRVRGRVVTDGLERVELSQRARVTLQGGYASGADPDLVRARLRFAIASRRRLRLTICPATGT
jgi:hypothetical protein